ncbi:MAG TPA: transglycosylase SLT domain-containing protein [Pyrinomonadaceae bacterium]|nr:transglycosylase SLT domain-containing protein [Pyrinomonadaceae bacterium]
MCLKHRLIFVLAAGVIQLAACASGEAEKGRFVVEQSSSPVAEAPSPVVHATTAPQSSPSPSVAPTAEMVDPPESAKLYLQMSEEEQYEFVERRARHISRMIGSGTYEFSRPSISYIKQYVDAYARRVGNGSKATWGEDLNYVFGRGQRYAPMIIQAFNNRRIPPAIGLYLVAVETEYTNFTQENDAGAAGLFQFIPSTAESYGVAPAQRTNVEKMSKAAAHYVADRIAEFGTDPMSVALCIAGYNRNPDSVRNDLQSVMNSANKERSFWTLVTNSNKLDKWFQGENIKYVPKYFAAAVVGETPWAFGLSMKQPLSTCTGDTTAAKASVEQ